MSEPTPNRGEAILFRHTVIVRASSSICGNCNANALPDEGKCRQCRTRFVFVGTDQRRLSRNGTESIDSARKSFDAIFPDLVFIGFVARSAWSPDWWMVTEDARPPVDENAMRASLGFEPKPAWSPTNSRAEVSSDVRVFPGSIRRSPPSFGGSATSGDATN